MSDLECDRYGRQYRKKKTDRRKRYDRSESDTSSDEDDDYRYRSSLSHQRHRKRHRRDGKRDRDGDRHRQERSRDVESKETRTEGEDHSNCNILADDSISNNRYRSSHSHISDSTSLPPKTVKDKISSSATISGSINDKRVSVLHEGTAVLPATLDRSHFGHTPSLSSLGAPPPPPLGIVPPPPPLPLGRVPPPLSVQPQKIEPILQKKPGVPPESSKASLMKMKCNPSIAIKLGGSTKPSLVSSALRKNKDVAKVASSVFGQESSEDEEEMPLEAKMRMRNVGRDTITSAGPNSFGKTRMGFCDAKKLFDRQLQDAMDRVGAKD